MLWPMKSVGFAMGLFCTAAAAADLRAHWTMDDTSDASGNGHDIALFGDAAFADAAGPTDGHITFDGAGYARTLAPAPDLDFQQGTVAFWVKADAALQSEHICLINYVDHSMPPFNGWAVEGGPTKKTPLNFVFFVTLPTGAVIVFEAADDLYDNEWHHVAMSVAAGAGEGGMSMWFDGRRVQNNLAPASITHHGAVMHFGASGDDLSRPFRGAIDDVQIYDHVLNSCDVTYLREHPGETLVPVECPIAGNDLCADSTALIEGETPFSTHAASTDGSPDASCDYDGQVYHDIWFTWESTCTGTLLLSTCEDVGGMANYDTDLAVYDGGDCAAPLLGCNDDAWDWACGSWNWFHSVLEVPVVAGNEYLVRVGGFGPGSTGQGVLYAACLPSCTPDGDTNDDGVVDVLDLLNVLGDWGCAGTCLGDANCDGVVNVLDLLIVLADWT